MQTWDDTLTEMKEIYSEGIDAVRSQLIHQMAQKLVENLNQAHSDSSARQVRGSGSENSRLVQE